MPLSDKDGAKKIVECIKAAPDKQVRQVIADKIVEKINDSNKDK